MSNQPRAVGDQAPDFTLRDQNGQDVTLSTLTAEKNVLVVFYPFAFSGICTGELDGIRDSLGDFVADDLQLLALSCDPMYAIRAWADDKGYFFPLLSDFWPHGDVARSYGVFHEGGGMAIRGTFLIDRDRIIRWSLVNGPGEERDFSGVQDVLREIRG